MCKKEYKVPGTNVTLDAGTSVIIPFKSIQNDPDFYPDPDKYDPDRFLPENKAKRHPLSFLPFGEGPRICLGKTKVFYLTDKITKKKILLLNKSFTELQTNAKIKIKI